MAGQPHKIAGDFTELDVLLKELRRSGRDPEKSSEISAQSGNRTVPRAHLKGAVS
jgi:hypothetical protein